MRVQCSVKGLGCRVKGEGVGAVGSGFLAEFGLKLIREEGNIVCRDEKGIIFPFHTN